MSPVSAHGRFCDERSQSERYRALVAEHADRGVREQPYRRDAAPAALTSLLAGLVPVPAPERERGAA